MKTSEMSYLRARIPKGVHKHLKAYCVASEQDLQDFAAIAIIQHLALMYQQNPKLKPSSSEHPVDALGNPLQLNDRVAHLLTPLEALGAIYQPRFPSSSRVGAIATTKDKQSFEPSNLVRLQPASSGPAAEVPSLKIA